MVIIIIIIIIIKYYPVVRCITDFFKMFSMKFACIEDIALELVVVFIDGFRMYSTCMLYVPK
jgi:hypothetical protein